MNLHKEFKITITPKIHIIMDHLADFFRMNGGQSLKITTDQLIEASHQHVKNVFRNSQFNVQDPIFLVLCCPLGSHSTHF